MTNTILGASQELLTAQHQTPETSNQTEADLEKQAPDKLTLELRKTAIAVKAAAGEMLNEVEAEVLQSLSVDVRQPLISMEWLMSFFLKETQKKLFQDVVLRAIDTQMRELINMRSRNNDLVVKQFWGDQLSEEDQKQIQESLSIKNRLINKLARTLRILQTFSSVNSKGPAINVSYKCKEEIEIIDAIYKAAKKCQSEDGFKGNDQTFIPIWWGKQLLDFVMKDEKNSLGPIYVFELLSSEVSVFEGEFWLDADWLQGCWRNESFRGVDKIPSNLNILGQLCFCTRIPVDGNCPSSIKIGKIRSDKWVSLRAVKEVEGSLSAPIVYVNDSPELIRLPYIKTSSLYLRDNPLLIEVTIDEDTQLVVKNCPLLKQINKI